MGSKRLKPREQGDFGELSAMEWLAGKGAQIYVPVGHSPDVDVVAGFGGRLLRVEVKTSNHRNEIGRWQVHISTRGGNQSWTGLVKYFDPKRCDFSLSTLATADVGSSRLVSSAAAQGSLSEARSTRSSKSSPADRLATITRTVLNSKRRGGAGAGEPGQAVNLVP
jgi:Holliday junction resolvase-like predicted endonuclease